MAETIQLNRDSGWINLGTSGIRLRAPGLQGTLIWRPAAEHPPLMASAFAPALAAAGATDSVDQAMQEAGLSDQGSLTVPAGTASFAGTPTQLILDHPIADDRV